MINVLWCKKIHSHVNNTPQEDTGETKPKPYIMNLQASHWRRLTQAQIPESTPCLSRWSVTWTPSCWNASGMGRTDTTVGYQRPLIFDEYFQEPRLIPVLVCKSSHVYSLFHGYRVTLARIKVRFGSTRPVAHRRSHSFSPIRTASWWSWSCGRSAHRPPLQVILYLTRHDAFDRPAGASWP